MAREQDRDPLAGEPLHELAHVAHPCGIETGRRLVEQEQLRVAQQRRRDAEPLLHPVRVAADAILRTVAQVDRVEHLLDARRRHAAVEIAEQAQVPAGGEIRIEPRALDEPRNPVEGPRAHLQGIAAEQQRAPRGGTDQTEQHAQRGGLARAVRSKVAEHVAALDRQVDAVDRRDLAVSLDETACGDRRGVGHRSERAAASAAAGGSEPASTYETPARSQVSTVPSCVASSCAVTPSSVTAGSWSSGDDCFAAVS